MIKAALLVALLAPTSAVFASDSPVSASGVLISGEETTKPYVKELDRRVEGDVTHTEMTPATYTLRNGIYLLPNGSCVERKAEPAKMERLQNGDGYIETPVIEETAAIVSCPKERG